MAEVEGAGWLSGAVETLPVAVVAVDDRRLLVLANLRARELLGVSAGQPAPQYLHGVVDAAVSGRRAWETRGVPGVDGVEVVVEIRAARANGMTVCTIDDLTERARRDRADREFITNAAHQLRTPITAIATAVEVLQRGAKETPESRDRFLDHIERQSARLVRLVRAMLTLSRAERGDVGPLLGLVPLQPMLAGLLAEVPADSRVVLELECAASAAVVADEALLSEALSNLIGNALEHAGGDRVRIVVAEESEPDVVTIEVIDAGVGIAPSELDHVFERFRQGTAARAGAGLGLSIALAAVVAQGGELTLESTPGAGTTARIRLPATA